MVAWTLVVHIFGIVFWIGGLLLTTLLLARHAQETAPEARAALSRVERKSMRAMADPGALLAIAAGITLILTDRGYYLHAAWLHIKLLFVLALIFMHGYIGIEMKRTQKGTGTLTAGRAWFLFATVVVIFLAILIVTLPGEVYLPH